MTLDNGTTPDYNAPASREEWLVAFSAALCHWWLNPEHFYLDALWYHRHGYTPRDAARDIYERVG
jgi:hypothetical protein